MFENIIPKHQAPAVESYNPYSAPQAEDVRIAHVQEPLGTRVYRLDVPSEVAFQRKPLRNKAIFGGLVVIGWVAFSVSILLQEPAIMLAPVSVILSIPLALPLTHLALMARRARRLESDARAFHLEISAESIFRYREGFRPVRIARSRVRGVAFYPRAVAVFGAAAGENILFSDRLVGFEEVRETLRGWGPEKPFLALREPIFAVLFVASFLSLNFFLFRSPLFFVVGPLMVGLAARTTWIAWCSPNIRWSQRLVIFAFVGFVILEVLLRLALAR